jgi:Zn-dependent M28 family amino/carboxypeptidase
MLAIALVGGPTLGQDAYELPADARATAEALIATALESPLAYDITESLTTEVGPRLAGTTAEARARAWAVAKLEELGFANVREEPFEMPGWERGEEKAEVVSPYPQRLAAAALGGSVATPEGGIEAEVAYLADFDTLMETPEGALAGKIAFIDGRMTRTQDGSGYGPANRKRRQGAVEAARRGAVAVLIRSVGTDSHRVPHAGGMGAPEEGVPAIPAAALSNPDADLLARMLARPDPVTVRLVLTPRSTGTVASGNVVAEVVGREAPDEVVVIGAHLDSWDLGTGAIDDGAGVGITVAAARLIADLPTPPRRTIRVVLFGAEEVGIHGANAYVATHADELGRHVIAAESDFGAGAVWRLDTGVGESALPKAAAIARVLGPLGVALGANDSEGDADIGPMHARGVPAVSLQQDGTSYFDLHHTADDTFDKIAPTDLRQNVAAYAAFAYLAAELPGDFRDEPGGGAEAAP